MSKIEDRIINGEVGILKENTLNATEWSQEIMTQNDIKIDSDYILANFMFLGFIRKPQYQNIKGYIPTIKAQNLIDVRVTTIKKPDGNIEYSSTPVFDKEVREKFLPVILSINNTQNIANTII